MKKILLLFCAFVTLQCFSQFPAPYCAEVSSFGVEPITLVKFAGINNVSSNLTTTSAHENFTNLIGNVSAGDTYPITLKGNSVGNNNNNYSVFVDWNADNDFLDAGENYEIGSIKNSDGIDAKQLIGSIAVPNTTTAGNKRMRVSKKYTTSITTFPPPCLPVGFGQGEDYTLVVTIPACIAPSNGLSTVGPFYDATLTWSAAGLQTNHELVYQIVGAGFPSIAPNSGNNIIGNSFTTPPLAEGSLYEFYVRTECADGVAYSNWSGPFKFNTVTLTVPNCPVYLSPANGATGVPRITNADTTNGVLLSYEPSTGDGVTPLLKYNIYKGTDPNNLTIVDPFFTFVETSLYVYTLPNTTYYWRVAPLNAIGEQVGCPVYSFTTAPNLATDNFDISKFKSFPNPVKDILNLSYDKNITSIAVVNLLGQVVLTNSLDNKEAKIDMSSLTTGTYMVKVTIDNEVKAVKVIKE